MLLYRLILLSWFICYNITYGRKSKKQRITSPLQQNQQSIVNSPQGLIRQGTINAPQVMGQQRAVTQQSLSKQRFAGTQSLAQQRMLNTQQSIQGSRRFSQGGMRYHHPARPTHVKAHSKDLLSQVVSSTIHHHRLDHPRKYVDYFDNGANWDHFMSKPETSNSEMNIDDANYHVHMKYGGHDELEEDDKLMGNHNGETYPGETISGENSLSKFMAPPVYDEYGENQQQREKERYEAEEKFAPDTPEAAETEKLNTEELVDRLNNLMTPLSPPFDSEGAKKTNLNRIIDMQNKRLKAMISSKHGQSYEDLSEGVPQHESAMTREKMLRYGSREEGRFRKPLSDEQADERMRVSERMRERMRNIKEGENMREPVNVRESESMRDVGTKGYREREREYQYFHRNGKTNRPQEDEEEEQNNNEESAYQRNRERMAAMLRRRDRNNRFEDIYRERLMHSRGNPRRPYGRDDREEEQEDSNENVRDNDNVAEAKDDSRSFANLKTRPDKEYESRFRERGVN